MNDVRGWIANKLREHGYTSTQLPCFQLEIERAARPNARVLCVGLENGEKFDAEDVDASIEAVPDTQFIVIVPTRITHAAYERAEELGICVAGFGELPDALSDYDNIAEHVDSQEKYERRRLSRHKVVRSIKRKGRHAYEIQLEGLRALTIITTDKYEFTADQLYTLLEDYQSVDAELIVITNPNCSGFSTESLRAAEHAGIPIVLFEDFLDGLGVRWA